MHMQLYQETFLYFMDNSWVCSCSICFRSSERLIDPKIPKHERVVESILYNLLGWKNATSEMQHDFIPLLEERGCLSLTPVKLHRGSVQERLSDRRGRQALPALLCMSLKGGAAPWQKWMCRAEGKSIQTAWRTAGQKGNWASIKFGFCCTLCHYGSLLALL